VNCSQGRASWLYRGRGKSGRREHGAHGRAPRAPMGYGAARERLLANANKKAG
jgi:hypothetical protein